MPVLLNVAGTGPKAFIKTPVTVAHRFLLLLALLFSVQGAVSSAHAQEPAVAPLLFIYLEPQQDGAQAEGAPVRFNLDALLDLMPGGEAVFEAPDGRSYPVVFDSLQRNKSGSVHWVGHLRGLGDDYRAVITWEEGGFGNIRTPSGEFVLETREGIARLIDLNTSSRPRPPMGDDIQVPLQPLAPSGGAASAQIFAQAAVPMGNAQIDVMVLYTPELVALWGADMVRTRIEHLVALSNQAYIDSQVEIQLRLAAISMVPYPPGNSLQTAFSDLENVSHAAFSNVTSLRSSYGADLVTLLRPWVSAVDPSLCGFAKLLGSNNSPIVASTGFSVVNDGNGCSDFSFAHELGHNMGSAHDRANVQEGVAPFYPYAYGYGVAGTFGTIMSYISPTVGKFSNPAISCATGQACGISEADPVNGANNALSLNNMRWAVAGFMPATTLSTTPNAFSFSSLSGVNSGDALHSETITVSGMSAAAPITIIGGEYRIDGGAFTNQPGTVSNGSTVQVRVTASATPYAAAVAYLSIGMLTKAFRVTTGPATVLAQAEVRGGFDHSLALRADGTVWAWGGNANGQLGDGSFVTRAEPVQITSLGGVTSISASQFYSMAAKSDGSVWVWGINNSNQLSDGTTITSNVPKPLNGVSGIVRVAAGGFRGIGLSGTGQVWTWGFTYTSPLQFTLPKPATAIAGGNNHGLALLNDGTVRAWGSNNVGQLGNSTAAAGGSQTPIQVSGLAGVTEIAAGVNHSLALKSDGTVWAWGDNSFGQLGDGTTTQRNTPVQVTGLAGVAKVAAGPSSEHSIAVMADGSLRAWGRNDRGQLGDGTKTNRLAPTPVGGAGNVNRAAAGGYHALALRNDGSILAWGANWSGQLGNGNANGTDVLQAAALGGGNLLFGAADNEPALFTLASPQPVARSALVVSNALTISGINIGSPISIVGGMYSLEGGPFTSTSGTVQSGQSVRVQVQASAAFGATQVAILTIGGISGSYSVTTIADTTAPSTPAGLALTSITSNQTNLSWTPSTDDGGVTQYKVYRNGTQVGTTATAAFVDTGLTSATSYSYTVLACDAAGNCSPQSTSLTASTQHSFTPNLASGFNLLGNSYDAPLNVMNTFGNQTAPVSGVTENIVSVWKWDATNSKWMFHSPLLSTSANATFAASKNYGVLTTIAAGEGYWVNSLTTTTMPTQSGAPFNWSYFSFTALTSGFNLISHTANSTPSQFNSNVSATPPSIGVVPTDNFSTLWMWDSANTTWYFYSPLLESSSGLPAVKAYADNKGFRHFQDHNKKIEPGLGFWVNKF